jgi:hypothetical protein
MIGTGMRGQVLLRELVRRDDVELVALCDSEPIMLGRAMAMVAKSGKPAPTAYGQDRDANAWKRMLAHKGLDGVIVATPWEWHAPMAIAAMQAGVHVFVEKPLAATAAEPATIVAVGLLRLEPAVARGAEEGDEDKAVAVAPANLPVAGEGDAVDVAGPPWVGLDLALDHVAEPDVACTMGRGGGEEAWKQKGAASIKICPVVVEESLLTISCMHG